MSLTSIVHDPSVWEIRRSLEELLDHPAFALSSPDTHIEEKQRQTYDQLKALNCWAGCGRALLAAPQRFFSMLEFAAVVNPMLLHVAQIHYGVCLYSALCLHPQSGKGNLLTDELDRMESIGCILATEIGHSSSHISTGTAAEYDPSGDQFILSTTVPENRKFMANVGLEGVPKIGLVTARLRAGNCDCGVFQFLVRIRTQHTITNGISISPVPGSALVPIDCSVVTFSRVAVSRGNWLSDMASLSRDGQQFHDPLGDPRQRAARSFVAFHNSSSAAAVGAAAMARACVCLGLRYAERRAVGNQSGVTETLFSFQVHRLALFRSLARAYSITCLVNRLVKARIASFFPVTSSLSSGALSTAPWATVSQSGGLTKCAAIDHAERVAGECRRLCGAQGTLPINKITVYEDFIRAYYAAGGDNNLIYFDAGRVMALNISYGAPELHVPSKLDLFTSETLRYIAGRKEKEHYDYLANALAETSNSKPGETELWDPLLSAATNLARAHSERLMKESLIEMASSDDREVVMALATLLAAEEIQANGPDKSASLAEQRALSVLVPQKEQLIEAFGLSHLLKNVPLMQDNYDQI